MKTVRAAQMLWIRNVNAVADSNVSHVLEAELGSEARITGQLELGGGCIVMRPLTYERDERGLLKTFVRLRLPAETGRSEKPTSGTRHGYLVPEGPLGELIALCSLKLGARIFLLSTTLKVSGSDLPIHKTEYRGPPFKVDPQSDATVFAETARNFTNDCGPFLSEIQKLPSKHHLDLAVAASRYASALRMIGIDPELVYVNLVSAVERLSKKQPIAEDSLKGLKDAEIFQTDTLTDAQLTDLKSMVENRKIKQRFVAFLRMYSSAFFANEDTQPESTQVTARNLAGIASAIYDARSGYLHNGDPMYISLSARNFPKWHMDPTVERTWQDRRFKGEQKLPTVEFFHRLVRHCILARINSLGRPPG